MEPIRSTNWWEDGFYEAIEFRGEERIVSATFPELELTAQQVLAGGWG